MMRSVPQALQRRRGTFLFYFPIFPRRRSSSRRRTRPSAADARPGHERQPRARSSSSAVRRTSAVWAKTSKSRSAVASSRSSASRSAGSWGRSFHAPAGSGRCRCLSRVRQQLVYVPPPEPHSAVPILRLAQQGRCSAAPARYAGPPRSSPGCGHSTSRCRRSTWPERRRTRAGTPASSGPLTARSHGSADRRPARSRPSARARYRSSTAQPLYPPFSA